MERSVRNKLKTGFTIARWGIDISLGALFIAIALIISAFRNGTELLPMLMIPFVMSISGILIFAVGRTIVGLQSRKLHFHMGRPLSEEERWFVSCMLEIENTGSGVQFFNSAARLSGNSTDDLAAGAAAAAVVGSFFKTGKRYMSRSTFINRLPVIVSLAAALLIIITATV